MNWENLMTTLPMMGLGMGGIILVTAVMIGCIVLLNKVFGGKK